MAGHESGRRTSSLIRSCSGLRDDSKFTGWEINNVQVIMTDGEEEVKSSRESPTGSFSSSSHIAAIFLIRKILFGVDDMSESCCGCLGCFTSKVALARASAAVLSQSPTPHWSAAKWQLYPFVALPAHIHQVLGVIQHFSGSNALHLSSMLEIHDFRHLFSPPV